MNSIYLEYLINNSSQIIFTIDSDGKFEFVSKKWTDLLGHSTNAVVGSSYTLYIHKDDQKRVALFLSQIIIKNNTDSKIEYRIKHKNGSWKWHEATCSFTKNEKNDAYVFLGSCRDITKIKNIQKKLINEQQKFRLLVEYTTDVMFTTTEDGFFTFISKEKTNLGYEPKDLLDTKYTEIIHEDYHESLFEYQMAKRNGLKSNSTIEILAKHKDGTYRWMLVKGDYIALDDMEQPQFVGTAIDIHEKVLEKNKIARDLKIFESIFEETLGGYWEWNLKKGVLFLSDKLKRTLGYKPTDYQIIENNPLVGVTAPDDFIKYWGILLNYIKSNPKKPFSTEIKFQHKLGHILTMIVAGVITEREGANIHKMIGCLVDITEITEVKNQLEIQNNELIILKDKEQKATNDIAYQILLGQERERNVIAQELHDGVNQLLFAAKIQLQEAKEFDSKMYLNGVSLIEKSIHEIRYIASNQNSFLMHNRSLYEGLNDLILSLPTTKVHFNLKVNNKFLVRLSDNKRIIVFRIIQELIHNILKHSDAKNANIFVKKTPLTISILVTDNGKGIDIAKIKKGNGLINIENKLKILNGFFDLKSKLNKGSMFYINFPVNA